MTGKKLLLLGTLSAAILAPADSECGWFSIFTRTPGACSTSFINKTYKRCVKLITPFIAGYTQLKHLDDCINTVYVKKDPRRDAIASTFLLLDNKKGIEKLAKQREKFLAFMKKKAVTDAQMSAAQSKTYILISRIAKSIRLLKR